MRDPDNLHHFYEYSDDVKDVIVLNELPPFDIPDYDLNDEKELKKYLFNIERVVRTSFEYTRWRKYLKENADMDQCAVFENVNGSDTPGVVIELHHEPLSLFDLVTIVYHKRLACRESLEVEMVAKEVMYNHFAMTIGIIPLSETVHELVGNQYLFIPSTKVFGNYKKFVQEYYPFIPQDIKDTLTKVEDYTLAYNGEEYKQLLQKKFICVDASSSYELPKLEDVAAALKSHLRGIITEELQTSNELHQPTKEDRPAPYCPIIFLGN